MEGDPNPEGPLEDEEEIFHGIKLLQARNEAQFMRWIDINETLFVVDSYGNTLLHWSAALGDLKVVTFLIEEGLDINARNAIGSTPILCAAASCRNPGAIIDCFIRRGANTDVVNLRNETLYSLLEQRKLHSLSNLFQLLQSTMDDCPKLFTSSGASKNGGVQFSQRSQLGSSEVLAKVNNAVRFKREGGGGADLSGTMDGTGTMDTLSNSYGANYLGGPFNVISPTQSFGSEGMPVCHGNCVYHQSKLRRLCIVEEELEREKIMREYWVILFQLTYEGTAPLGSELELYGEDGEYLDDNVDGEYLDDNVARVLGERYADGHRWLLVQWMDEDGNALPKGMEEWVAMHEVKHCQAVCSYFLNNEPTSSTMESSSLQSSQTPRFGLDPREREELEQELVKIAQRKLVSPGSSLRRSRSPTQGTSPVKVPSPTSPFSQMVQTSQSETPLAGSPPNAPSNFLPPQQTTATASSSNSTPRGKEPTPAFISPPRVTRTPPSVPETGAKNRITETDAAGGRSGGASAPQGDNRSPRENSPHYYSTAEARELQEQREAEERAQRLVAQRLEKKDSPRQSKLPQEYVSKPTYPPVEDTSSLPLTSSSSSAAGKQSIGPVDMQRTRYLQPSSRLQNQYGVQYPTDTPVVEKEVRVSPPRNRDRSISPEERRIAESLPPLPKIPTSEYGRIPPQENTTQYKKMPKRPGSNRAKKGSHSFNNNKVGGGDPDHKNSSFGNKHSSDAWKNASFNSTVSSTNSDGSQMPSIGELIMRGGYKPLDRKHSEDNDPPVTSGTRAFRSMFVQSDRGYTPYNLRPKYKRGNVLMSERQKQQYQVLHQIASTENHE